MSSTPPAPKTDPPAVPAGRRAAERNDHSPKPFFRGTLTFNKSDDDCPVTVEILILAEGDTDAPGAFSQTPEFHQAGWSDYSLGPYEVCMRVVH